MKSFTRSGFRIANSPQETKLVYTFFLIIILLGFATIAIYQCHVIGWGLDAIVQHYRGNERDMTFPKSFLQLLELSHAHAFIMGILYLTMAHILIATRISTHLIMFLIVVGFIVTLADLVSPWLIRYGGSEYAMVLLAAWIGEWIVYLSYIFIPMVDMWLIPADEE